MATMESLIGLVNRIQRACTVLGDYGGEGMSLWEALPSVAVVGGQVLSRVAFLILILAGVINFCIFCVNIHRVLENLQS